ncbi:hypothetical protein B0H19DRAFT_1075544 [Mycena capillaripes]|nr:hypothetical protein B0H19DRAFT_1075544 [Mycena capillaripes]
MPDLEERHSKIKAGACAALAALGMHSVAQMPPFETMGCTSEPLDAYLNESDYCPWFYPPGQLLRAAPAPDFPVTLFGAAIPMPFPDPPPFDTAFISASVLGVAGDVTTYQLLHSAADDPGPCPGGFTLTYVDTFLNPVENPDPGFGYNCQFAGGSVMNCILNAAAPTTQYTRDAAPLLALFMLTMSGDPLPTP